MVFNCAFCQATLAEAYVTSPRAAITLCFPPLHTSLPAERLCQEESIKTCTSKWDTTVWRCASLHMVSELCRGPPRENVWICGIIFKKHTHACEGVYICVRKCLCERTGGGGGSRGTRWAWHCSAAHSSGENASDGTGTAVANLYRFVGHDKRYDIPTDTHELTFSCDPGNRVWPSCVCLSGMICLTRNRQKQNIHPEPHLYFSCAFHHT